MSLNKKTPIKPFFSFAQLLTLIVIGCIGMLLGFGFKHFSENNLSNKKSLEITAPQSPSLKISKADLNVMAVSKEKNVTSAVENKRKSVNKEKVPPKILQKTEMELEQKKITIKSKIFIKTTQPLQQVNQDANPNLGNHATQIDINGKNKIVIVFDDMGVDKVNSKIVTNLLAPLTLSYLPYSRDIKEQTHNAANKGHELLMHIPMEPINNKIDPGPNVLLDGVPKDELLHTLHWNLSQFTKFVGVNNHMGSNFTSNYNLMKIVFQELKKRELFFLDSLTSNNSKGEIVAKSLNLPFIKRDLFIDHIDDEREIRKQLLEVEKISQARGFVIAICHPRKKTINIIKPWLKTLNKKGFQLIPLSKVIASKISFKNK